MHSLGINGEGEVRGQPANRGLPGKIAVKTVCVCVGMPFKRSCRSIILCHWRHSNHGIRVKCVFVSAFSLTSRSICFHPRLLQHLFASPRGPNHPGPRAVKRWQSLWFYHIIWNNFNLRTTDLSRHALAERCGPAHRPALRLQNTLSSTVRGRKNVFAHYFLNRFLTFFLILPTFGALTVLVGWHEGHPTC